LVLGALHSGCSWSLLIWVVSRNSRFFGSPLFFLLCVL
jgi:hypothetical protein